MNMKKHLIILISTLLVYACVNQKGIMKTQGFNGEIRWVEGNLMPTIGDTTYAIRARGVPIVREIFIYETTHPSDVTLVKGTFYKSITTKLVKKVKSKKDGTFKVILPPGKYSVFVLDKEGFFANTFDGENCISPVTVQANNFTEIKILLNYKAYY